MSWLLCDHPLGSWKPLCTAVLPTQQQRAQTMFAGKSSSVDLPTLLRTCSLENNKEDNHSCDYRVQIKCLTQEGRCGPSSPTRCKRHECPCVKHCSHLPRFLVLNVIELHLKQSTCTSFKNIKVYGELWRYSQGIILYLHIRWGARAMDNKDKP